MVPSPGSHTESPGPLETRAPRGLQPQPRSSASLARETGALCAALDDSDLSLSRYVTLSSYRAFLNLNLLICEMKLSLPPRRAVGRNTDITQAQPLAQPGPPINDLGSLGRKRACARSPSSRSMSQAICCSERTRRQVSRSEGGAGGWWCGNEGCSNLKVVPALTSLTEQDSHADGWASIHSRAGASEGSDLPSSSPLFQKNRHNCN